MVYKLIIGGTLPNLNDYIRDLNAHRFKGSNLKKNSEDIVKIFIKNQLKGVKISNPVRLEYLWVEPNKKRDLDNICAFGMKVIHDALVQSGVMKNDGWGHVSGFSHDFAVDKQNPRIEITIREIVEQKECCQWQEDQQKEGLITFLSMWIFLMMKKLSM